MERGGPGFGTGGSWTAGGCPVLVERDVPFARLRAIAERAAGGDGQLAVVTGEAGAGKSRLTREFAATLTNDWQSRFVRVEAGATNPFGELVGEVAAGDVPSGSIGRALGRALAERAGGVPLVVVVEDLERADPVLISALASTLDALAAAPVLIVSTFRLGGHSEGGEQTASLAEVLRGPCAHEVRLAALSRAGVSQMAEAMGRALSEAEAGALHERGGGNPFFVEELLNAPPGALPWTITESIVRRLAALPAPALEVAHALACAFDPVPRLVVEGVVHQGGEGAVALLDAGVAIAVPQDQIALRHALVCEVVTAQLTARAKRDWNGLLAASLEDQPAISAARLARYWRDAGDGARAARWAVIAADDAARGRAYRTATELYRVALSSPDGEELEQAELFDRAAAAAGSAGLVADALEWASRADAGYRNAGTAWRAVAMWLNPALREVPKPAFDHRDLDADAIPRLLVEAHEATRRGALDEAVQLARRVVELSDERSDAGVLSTASAARRLMSAGRIGECDEIMLRLRAAASASRNRTLQAKLAGGMAMIEACRGDFVECLRFNREALALSQDGEQSTWPNETAVALTLVYVGDLDEASELVDRLIASDNPLAVGFAQLPACVIDLERGDLPGAGHRLELLRPVTTLGVADWTVGVLLARARWHYLAGEFAQVIETVSEVRPVTGDLFEPSRLGLLMLTIRSAHELGDDATAARACASLAQIVELGGRRGCRAAATWATGVTVARSGSFDRAVILLESAAADFERAGRLVHAADTWIDLAGVAVASGDDVARQRAVTRAREIAEPRRLVSVLARLQDRLHPQDRADFAGPLRSLSDREREIALLVAAGKTNREIAAALFVSEHTIRNQLVNVFAKLGVSRRTELARLVPRSALSGHDQTGQREAP